MEVRIKIDERYMQKLLDTLREEKATEVTKNALTLLNWAASEARNGRVIVSTNPDGTGVHRLAMPALEKAALNNA